MAFMSRAACKRGAGQKELLRLRLYSYAHRPKPKKPHILGPAWRWRKCYTIHPMTQISDPLQKYQWLTKTAVIEGLPQSVLDLPSTSTSVVEDFQLRTTEVFSTREERVRKRTGRMCPSEVTRSVLQGIFPSVWSLAEAYPHLSNSPMAYEPKVEAYWRRAGLNFICRPQPSYILHTRQPLTLFHDDTSFAGNKTIPTGLFHPQHMSIFEHSYDQIRPFGGFKMGSSYSFCHTVLAANTTSRTRDQVLAHGLMTLFAQSAAQTVQYGYHLDEDLVFPLATQGIITNGRKFTFVCFQLNTLNLGTDMGTWNILWTGPTLNLFDRFGNGSLSGFSEECAQLFLKFLINPPTRRKPEHTGFQLDQMQAKKVKEGREEAIRYYREHGVRKCEAEAEEKQKHVEGSAEVS